jgi:putative ABC transport system permease protein
MRKVIGARRAQLIGQFLGESTLMAFASLLVALIITEIILPHFNLFVGKELDVVYTSGWVLPSLLALGLVLGITAGSYPALYLSSFSPARVLKGESWTAGGGITTIRRTLVVLQFIITIALIIGTAVVYRQLEFTRNTDLGFQRDLLVKIPLVENMTENVDAIKAELVRHSSIASVTASWGTPGGFLAGDGVRLPGRESQWPLRVVSTDYDFITSYGMRMAAGRDFSRRHPSDEHEAFIINEAAAQEQGWTPEDALGKELDWDMWAEEGVKRGRIIGVVENFHYGPLRDGIEPVMINIHPVFGHLSIRLRPGGVAAALGAIEAEWNRWTSSRPFEYTFLEEELAEQYVTEEKLARVCAVFAGLAIVIACLGLFGLTSFMVGQRTKEIGIRKVMGASVEGIVLLLSRDFATLVVVAFVIATPIAYVAANQWLEDFAYRIDVEPLVFIIAGLVSLVIAISTVSYHTIRAAMSDPIRSLRYE